MPRHLSLRLLISLVAAGQCHHAQAADAADAAGYLQQVQPILEHRCFACHGPLKQEASLRLDTGRAIRAGGDSGPAVTPGDAGGSILVQRISARDASERMPPEGAPLKQDEIRTLVDWVNSGAASPANELAQEDPKSHWAFCAPVRPPLPNAASSSTMASKNPIDAFINAKLQAHNLRPMPEAARSTLLRRVYVDLIGVPPTRDELHRFLADTSPTAYDKVVDQLLEKPAYGERWGRHWMDVWRYSDWYGRRAVPDVMNSYPQIWRWRDWIVNSLNEDKGYDRMVQQMLAADELGPVDDANVVATGFLVRNWFKWNYENWMKDNVEHTAKAFLGLTLNCAQCHDHKYDPLSQEDYFHFRAFFEPLELRQDRVAGLPDPGQFMKYDYAKSYGPIAAGLIRVFDEKLDAQTFMYIKGDARNRVPGKPPLEPRIPELFNDGSFKIERVKLPPEAYYPGLRADIRADDAAKLAAESAAAENEAATAHGKLREAQSAEIEQMSAVSTAFHFGSIPLASALHAAQQASKDAARLASVSEASLAFVHSKQESMRARIAADDAKYFDKGDAASLARIAFASERTAAYNEALLRLAAAEAQLETLEQVAHADANAVAQRQKAKQEVVEASKGLDAAKAALATTGEEYTRLSPVYPPESTGRRSALAGWITSPTNPLTARVAINHMWMRHFGRGLVDTPNNFGRSGHKPSHPELLDWLAVELMENNWRMKHIHRLIVTSDAYCRRSSAGDESKDNLTGDPDNHFYWRANTRRMEAEVVRDSLLACSGELDSSLGGQELDASLGMSSHRRSLYFAIHGEGKMQFLEMFDAPDVCDCYQRAISVRPQQALALANNDLALDLSRKLAARLCPSDRAGSAGVDGESQFVASAFESILSRPPTETERQLAIDFLGRQAQTLKAARLEEFAPKLPESPQRPSSDLSQRARESLIHALFNHNDFVTVR